MPTLTVLCAEMPNIQCFVYDVLTNLGGLFLLSCWRNLVRLTPFTHVLLCALIRHLVVGKSMTIDDNRDDKASVNPAFDIFYGLVGTFIKTSRRMEAEKAK